MKSILPIFIFAMILCTTSCSGRGGNETQDKATELLTRTQQALDRQNYDLALGYLDSLDSQCRDAVDIRRSAMPLRAKAIEGKCIKAIPETDENIARTMMAIDKLGSIMAPPADPADPYRVPQAWPGRGDILAEGIEPRVDLNGFFRIAVKSTGKALDISHLVFSSGSDSVEIPLPASRVSKIEGCELISLSQEEFAPVAQWLADHSGSVPEVEIAGTKGSRKLKFDAKRVELLNQAWQYSQACQLLQELRKERERLERQMKIARDQQANL